MTKCSTPKQTGLPTLKLEEASKVLESISCSFSKRSKAYRALELAAKSLHFVYQSESKEQFIAFVKEFDSELTVEQRKKLRSMGIKY